MTPRPLTVRPPRPPLAIVLTGGGTAGHRLPLVAVYQALASISRPAALYLGEERDCRSPEIIALGIPTASISAGKLRRYLSWQNLVDAGRVIKGYFRARALLREYHPQIVFSKGGYVSVPVVWAAASLGIPVVTHESDIVMGLANRLNARRAAVVCTAYAKEYYRALPRAKIQPTGNLVRAELIAAAAAPVPPKLFTIGGRKVAVERPLLVVLGGSQGAHRINELIVALLPTLLSEFIVIHQTGSGDSEWLQQKRSQLGRREKSYFPVPFLKVEELASALANAAVVVSRAGSVISELSLFARPTILIPLPTSAGGHQLRNAKLFERQRAALVLPETGLKPADLAKTIRRLMTRPELAAALSKGMRGLADPNGARRVARILLSYAAKR